VPKVIYVVVHDLKHGFIDADKEYLMEKLVKMTIDRLGSSLGELDMISLKISFRVHLITSKLLYHALTEGALSGQFLRALKITSLSERS